MLNTIATILKWIIILTGSGYLLFILCFLTLMVTGDEWDEFRHWKSLKDDINEENENAV